MSLDREAENHMTQYGALGFQSIEVLIENNFGNPPCQGDLQQ